MADYNYMPPSYFNNNWERIITNDESIVSYISSCVEKSMSFLRSNRGWKSADICMNIFYGDETERLPQGLSKVSVKKLRRQAREAVANASNIRPRWKHRSKKEDIKRFVDQARTYDKLRDDWYWTQFVDQKIKAALQYAAGGGTGYIWLWPELDNSTGQLEIIPKVLSWRQFLPHHAGVDASIENLYSFTIHEELPVPEAHRKYPNHKDILVADRNVPSFFAKSWKKISRAFKGVGRRMQENKEGAALAQDPYPVTDVFYTWINDDSINTSGHNIPMGEAGAHSSYIVPSLYKEDGTLNPELTREDCKLFPYKRLIISTRLGVISDGPPKWINRFPPVVQFTFEKVVGEFLGINIIRDGRRLEESANNMLRSIEDAINGRLSPPIGIDPSVAKTLQGRLKNVRAAIGKVFEMNSLQSQKAITPLMSADYYTVDRNAIDIIKYNQEMQDYLMGTRDLSALARLNQMPAADTQEHFLEALGALATDHSRGIEQSMMQLAKVWLDFAPQVYTTERVIILLGAAAIIGTYDFDPNSLIPFPEEYPNIIGDNAYPARLQKHMRNFSIYAAPNSLMERMSQTNKLIYMTLLKMGVEIPNETLYDLFIDDGQYLASKDKWKKEQLEKILLSAALQKALESANQEADPKNQLASALRDKIAGTNNEGRPSSNSAPPRLTQKKDENGAPRSTIETS